MADAFSASYKFSKIQVSTHNPPKRGFFVENNGDTHTDVDYSGTLKTILSSFSQPQHPRR
ncbi:protein of unknown function [Candidatus Nitrotoga arctica]|uniref:Uncharacterized protein n=1 Tax=Candidatus Nitrotoga arctica TaxID=453162 RepID=A0ABM8YXH6_9PROT|nr:protein of unknown function [Candidatus Nitrotoga arctica]